MLAKENKVSTLSPVASLTRKAKERVKERAEEEGVITAGVDTMVIITKVTKTLVIILVIMHHPDSWEGVIIIQVVREVMDTINLPIIQTRISKVATKAKVVTVVRISSNRIGSKTLLTREVRII